MARPLTISRVALATAQCVCGARVLVRLLRTRSGAVIEPIDASGEAGSVSVVVPVLDEAARLGRCLEALQALSPIVAEILVTDGGSRDSTVGIAQQAAMQDARIRVVDAAPLPDGVNGKAYGLLRASESISSATKWMLVIDADVEVAAGLAAALVAFARERQLAALSVAVRQRLPDRLSAPIHGSMLATLVYRFGIPGHATSEVAGVQANGQCLLLHREALARAGGFEAVLGSINEDVTLARRIASVGSPVGFYEAPGLVSVQMHASARALWRNWPRSLPLRDNVIGARAFIGLAEVLFAQALPPWVMINEWRGGRVGSPLARINLALLVARLGMLGGMRRAYVDAPASYWAAPLLDLPVAVRLWISAFRRRHVWRGRVIVRT